MVLVPLGEFWVKVGGVCEAQRSVCSWGVRYAAHCKELRAAGDSGVFSAGPAGCFYKEGDLLLHNAHTHTCISADTHTGAHRLEL